MTCIVGVAHKGKVYMGADSAAVQGWTRRQTKLVKVFRRGPFLMGYTTSFRMGQLLEHQLALPQQKGGDDLAFLVQDFVEAVRDVLKRHGYSKVEANNESAGQFLLGYRGQLYSIDSDYQVGLMADGFDAVGSGSEYALGALKSLERMQPQRRIKRALEVAAHFSMAVAPPFVVRTLPAPR